MTGFFITFEGGEGVGKSTQIQLLADALKARGQDVVITREPGGTPQAELLRGLLSHSDHGETWSPEAECMLLFAARAMHIRDMIAPAIRTGKTVISDRFIDSTRAYQGYLQGLEMAFIHQLEQKIVGAIMPNLTIILDMPVEQSLARVKARGAVDHYDRADQSVHETLRDAFLDIASQEPQRCQIVNADQPIDDLSHDIITLVMGRMDNNE